MWMSDIRYQCLKCVTALSSSFLSVNCVYNEYLNKKLHNQQMILIVI